MTEQATEITQGEPPTVDGPSVRPGYLTTEFWQTNFVHLFAGVSSLLVFANVNIAHLTVVQGLIPLLALAASLVAQYAYNDKRARVKMHQLQQWGEVNVAKAQAVAPIVTSVVNAVDPTLVAKAEGAAHAFESGWTEFPSTAEAEPDAPAQAPAEPVDPAPADPAPTSTTDVQVPDDMPVEGQ